MRVRPAERFTITDAPAMPAHAWVTSATLAARALQHRRGSCWWTVDLVNWVVTLDSPQRQELNGRTLEEALAWCLKWLMAPEIGNGPFLA